MDRVPAPRMLCRRPHRNGPSPPRCFHGAFTRSSRAKSATASVSRSHTTARTSAESHIARAPPRRRRHPPRRPRRTLPGGRKGTRSGAATRRAASGRAHGRSAAQRRPAVPAVGHGWRRAASAGSGTCSSPRPAALTEPAGC
eukprot:scaffold4802_cov112-Isochrysis_galbana.AAC.6